MIENLNKENYLLLAAKHYNTPKCVLSEFEEDINRIRFIKKLFTKYEKKQELHERLILNHLIIYANVFGVEFSVKLLFFLIDKKHWPVLKTFLIYLGYLKEKIQTINNETIIVSDIPLDMKIVEILRKI